MCNTGHKCDGQANQILDMDKVQLQIKVKSNLFPIFICIFAPEFNNKCLWRE